MIELAIIGHGFVGKAVDYGFNNKKIKKHIIDPRHGTTIQDLKGKNIAASFVCVPTPMREDGSIDSSIVEDVVTYLKDNVFGYIIIKSTITPDILKKLCTLVVGSRIVYNPEFLTEKSANEDFVNPKMHVFGGHPEITNAVENMYHQYSSCKPCPVYHMTPEEASLVKYGINSFLATKVLWFNQFYDIIEKSGSNYDTVINAITTDDRIGKSHTSVPGFDGKRGFGLSCFPKDTVAFSKYAEGSFTVLQEVIRANNGYRKMYTPDSRETLNNITFDKE